MKLTYNLVENMMKLFFSAVIFQLLFISLGADSGSFSAYFVRTMLEYSAASAVVTLGGGLLLEYILRNEVK